MYTYFCKKGGVGKTTVTGEHADYLASKGSKVLILSIDDQNSVFEVFGKGSEIYADEDNYFEHYILGEKSLEDTIIPFRANLFGIKTLNTDMLSKKLTLERSFEKTFLDKIKSLYDFGFEYIFIDLPPSSNRTSELLLELCTSIFLIVETNKLGVNGFYNTLQYFVDCSIPLEKIRYIIPNSFSKNKSAPTIALDELKTLANEHLNHAKIIDSIPEKAIITTLQQLGISLFDDDVEKLSSYQKTQKKLAMEIFKSVFDQIELN
ncbi:MAG: ParA family protein [Anaeroplasmataceae bacterium]